MNKPVRRFLGLEAFKNTKALFESKGFCSITEWFFSRLKNKLFENSLNFLEALIKTHD